MNLVKTSALAALRKTARFQHSCGLVLTAAKQRKIRFEDDETHDPSAEEKDTRLKLQQQLAGPKLKPAVSALQACIRFQLYQLRLCKCERSVDKEKKADMSSQSVPVAKRKESLLVFHAGSHAPNGKNGGSDDVRGQETQEPLSWL